ncbi:CAZyme family GT1 [Penicillium roqueforti]|uniref:UDP-glucuronosyl/UDP-glucosyltransferase n=1 Tax=Penicillium roqueforti (strain FM164) TaxID=1365484 RepID=W6R6Z0_PENRF|nr:CAZyme family GT1 [Penicillium roqueforti]CDM37607.1 UDP-glucuronosyl/UDP-glucosyltransferase [Penicillium roqueforti FM164]KAF9239754.1 CAZyme family GT1 [Penicillium roqueforti]KAI1829771.1 CAZyme family GT1 [Penicillium roqueforti]KAI2670227.1 CAZyme family GT1 [Penicillium roqueforti]KAI2672527.1 CAZyme family GT1 [Penicillium roqueforti]
MSQSQIHLSRKILLVVTTGGFTHAAPVLEIGRVLAERGHEIEFATLEGQESWVKPEYDFVNKLHQLGPGPTPEQLDGHYRRMQAWDISKGVGQAMESKYMFDSFWPQTYHRLKEIMDDPATRPDMIVADFFVEAANDIHFEYKVPIAIICPNMPLFQLPCPYIPGQPGFQLPGTMTSEDTSMWLRIMNEIFFFPDLPAIVRAGKWSKKMRSDNGVFYPPHKPSKPDYLIFVNSFFGLEIPRDLPPTAAPVGPLLSPTYPPLDQQCGPFLARHKSVLYIALGTHIILPHKDAAKIVKAANRLQEDGMIDGVIWAMGKTCRADLDRSASFQFNTGDKNEMEITLGDLLDNKHPNWIFPFFAPQRAILDNESTKLYFTHGGGSSANEGLYHGKPMLSMGIFSDQIANTARLVAGGVAESLSKLNFTSDEVYTKAMKILKSENETYSRNVLRLQRIANVASRRKYHAADLIEELMYDNELRFKDGKELRPMHLQTADMRMSTFKARNWDLYAVSGLALSAVVGSMWLAGRFALRYRGAVIG